MVVWQSGLYFVSQVLSPRPSSIPPRRSVPCSSSTSVAFSGMFLELSHRLRWSQHVSSSLVQQQQSLCAPLFVESSLTRDELESTYLFGLFQQEAAAVTKVHPDHPLLPAWPGRRRFWCIASLWSEISSVSCSPPHQLRRKWVRSEAASGQHASIDFFYLSAS